MYPLPCIQSKPMSILSVAHATESKAPSVCHEPSLRLNCPNLRVPLGGLLRGCDTKSYSEIFSWMSWVGMRRKGKYKDFLPRVGEGFWEKGCLETVRTNDSKSNRGSQRAACVLPETAFQTAFSLFCFFWRSPDNSLSRQLSLAILCLRQQGLSSSSPLLF